MNADVSYVTVFRTRPRHDFLVRPYRQWRGRPREVRGIAYVEVPKAQFIERIAGVALEELSRFHLEVDETEFDRARIRRSTVGRMPRRS
jgi:hypothetical protein